MIAWHKAGKFADHDELLAEALSCACLLGRTETARYFIDAGVDPYAGMKTGLAGPHYAVSGGHLDIVKMLIEREIPLEIKNVYGGTMLGQALWSAVNEHKPSHADTIEILINAGAEIEPGTLEWWMEQVVPYAETKMRVSYVLRRHDIK
jgi:ankyrin repeat protein